MGLEEGLWARGTVIVTHCTVIGCESRGNETEGSIEPVKKGASGLILLCSLQYVPLATIQTTMSKCQNSYWDGNWYNTVLYSPVGFQKHHGQRSNHLSDYKHNFELLDERKSKSTVCESCSSDSFGAAWLLNAAFWMISFCFSSLCDKGKNQIKWLKFHSAHVYFFPKLSRATFNK